MGEPSDRPGNEPAGEPSDKPGTEPNNKTGNEPGDDKSAGRARRGPGRNVPIAVGVGVVLGGLVLLSLYTVKQIFLGVVVVFLAVATWELVRALGARDIRVPRSPLLAGGAVMLVASYVWGASGLIGGLGLTALAIMIGRMPGGQNGYVRDMTAGVFAAAYVPFLAGFVALMLAAGNGPDQVVTFIAVTIASDTGGFFAGAFLGRHKIAPAISPKKTWEGFAGSVVTSMVVGALLLPWLLDGHWWAGVIVGGLAVLSATLGDLVESMIKRDLGIKDMGSLLPEHGGVLDRLDSLLATAPIVWLAYQALLPS